MQPPVGVVRLVFLLQVYLYKLHHSVFYSMFLTFGAVEDAFSNAACAE